MTFSVDTSWVARLKEGDAVFISSRDSLSRHTVTRVTPKQIVVDHWKFRREDGREIGNHSVWSWNTLVEATTDVEHEYQARRARTVLREMRWSELSDAAVIEVLELIARLHPKAKK